MLRESLNGVQSIARAAALLKRLATPHATSLAAAAEALALPPSTAHRIAAELTRHGLISRVGRGRFVAGFGLVELARGLQPNDVLIEVARPILRRLAATTGRTAHMAQFDCDMVTYLVREAPPGGHLFTREAMQLEAYCSGVGKMLLAMAGPAEREAYLSSGSFIPLTDRTLIDPDILRAQLDLIAARGYSVDEEEVEQGLFCLAIPLRTPHGLAPTALSLAGAVPAEGADQKILDALHRARADLDQAFGIAIDPFSRARPCQATNRP